MNLVRKNLTLYALWTVPGFKNTYIFYGEKKDAEYIDDDTEVLLNSLRVVFIEEILQVQGQIAFQDFLRF